MLALGTESTGKPAYTSRFHYGVERELQRAASPCSSDDGGAAPSSAAFPYSLHSKDSLDEPRAVLEHIDEEEAQVGNDSLNHVQDDVGYLRAQMSYLEMNGSHKQASSHLPKRLSVKGVFENDRPHQDPRGSRDEAINESRGTGTIDGLPKLTRSEIRM